MVKLILTHNSSIPRYPVIYMSADDAEVYSTPILSRFYLPKSVISVVPYNISSPNSRTLDIKAFERLVSDDVACGKLPLLAITTIGMLNISAQPIYYHLSSSIKYI